jgi:hypothetical protein
LKKFRGLLALIFVTFFTLTLHAKFIVVDEVVKLEAFDAQVEPMGQELAEKSGIHVYMSLSKELENNQSIIEYQKALIQTLDEPAILLSFVERDKQVQIYAADKSLYELFDKDQIMNPLAIWPFFNGSIIPILGAKSKGIPEHEKYATAMFNGYAEICEQIAASKEVELDTAVGNTNKNIYKFLISLIFLVSSFTVIKLIYNARKRREDA